MARSCSSIANVLPLSLLLYPPVAPPALVYLAPVLPVCPALAPPACRGGTAESLSMNVKQNRALS